MKKEIILSEIIGAGYEDFWNFKGRYRIVKGSRASKKSKTTALWYIINLMANKDANMLVVRKIFDNLRVSCFAELTWAINWLGVDNLWNVTKSPLEITFLPTGQKILFRGFDDPMKITSIAVPKGYLCWVWIEEAYQIDSEKDFDMLDGSIRGYVPNGLFKQITLTLNPWTDKTWIKRRFFDVSQSDDILAKTTNYLCNEFLDSADKRFFEQMRINNPKYYEVAGLGNWGITGGLVYDNWKIKEFDYRQLSRQYSYQTGQLKHEELIGLDFGFAHSYMALIRFLHCEAERTIYIFDEFKQRGMLTRELVKVISAKGLESKTIVADSESSQTIADMNDYGLHLIPAKKPKGGKMEEIRKIKEYQIFVLPKCEHTIDELSNYIHKEEKNGSTFLDDVEKKNDDLLDALRYGMQGKNSRILFG